MSILQNNQKKGIIKKTSYLRRFSQLAKMGEIIFHIDDLALIWGIKNKKNLNITLKRYADKGLLFRIYRGLYSLRPIDGLDPLLLGARAVRGFCYLSTESVLAQNGVIQQKISAITLIGQKSRKFSLGEYNFSVRKLADKFLFNPLGINSENGIKKASTERAIADMLYFNAKTYFDAKNINWKKVQEMQKALGYPLTPKRYR